MRSVVKLIEVAIVTVATLVVAAVLFALAIGQEHVCHGIAEVTERGMSVPLLLVGYCTQSQRDCAYCERRVPASKGMCKPRSNQKSSAQSLTRRWFWNREGLVAPYAGRRRNEGTHHRPQKGVAAGMLEPSVNRAFRLRRRPQGRVTEADLELVEEPVPDLERGEFVPRPLVAGREKDRQATRDLLSGLLLAAAVFGGVALYLLLLFVAASAVVS